MRILLSTVIEVAKIPVKEINLTVVCGGSYKPSYHYYPSIWFTNSVKGEKS